MTRPDVRYVQFAALYYKNKDKDENENENNNNNNDNNNNKEGSYKGQNQEELRAHNTKTKETRAGW